MKKPAITDHPLHDLMAERWSPRAFADKSVSDDQVGSLLEAARWAASCFNEQPWRFITATREQKDAFAGLLGCLAEKNQSWAKNAAVLMISVASTTFAHNGKANRHAYHDVGLATAQLVLQATAMGLGVHQMAGFSQDKAREVCGIPEGYEPVTAIAIGHPGAPEILPDPMRERELAPRSRKSLSEIAFVGTFSNPRGS